MQTAKQTSQKSKARRFERKKTHTHFCSVFFLSVCAGTIYLRFLALLFVALSFGVHRYCVVRTHIRVIVIIIISMLIFFSFVKCLSIVSVR